MISFSYSSDIDRYIYIKENVVTAQWLDVSACYG